MKIKYQLRFVAMGITLITGLVYVYSIRQLRTTPPTQEQTENIITKIGALGRLEPEGEIINLSARVSEGNRIAQVLITAGDKVSKGQIIAILDTHERSQAVLLKAQADVAIAQTNLAKIKAGVKTGEITAQEARIANIEAQLRGQIATGETKISRLETELAADIEAQLLVIQRIKAEWSNAKTECDRLEQLYVAGVVTASERDNICLKQQTWQKNLEEAQVSLNRIRDSGQELLRETRETLLRTIETLKQQQAEAIATLDSLTEVREIDVELAQAELNGAFAQAKIAQTELDLTQILSPIDGQVLKVHVRPGEVIGNNGIAEIGQIDQMYVVAQVYDSDINKVRLGQKAIITSSAISGQLQGEVTFIGLEVNQQDVFSSNPQANTDHKVVEVKIRLTPEDSQKVTNLSNLQVEVVIEP